MQVPYEVGGVLGLWHLGTVDSVEFDAAAAVHAKWASLCAPACNSILTQFIIPTRICGAHANKQ